MKHISYSVLNSSSWPISWYCSDSACLDIRHLTHVLVKLVIVWFWTIKDGCFCHELNLCSTLWHGPATYSYMGHSRDYILFTSVTEHQMRITHRAVYSIIPWSRVLLFLFPCLVVLNDTVHRKKPKTAYDWLFWHNFYSVSQHG